MQWSRGGRWQPVTDEGSGDLWAVRTSPPEPYELASFEQQRAIIDSYAKFLGRESRLAQGLRQREGNPTRDPVVALCRLLEDHGPLGDSPGASSLPWDLARNGAVHLKSFEREVSQIASLHFDVNIRPRSVGAARKKLEASLTEYLERLQADLQVIPRFRRGQYGYDVQPTTLRALLWERLFCDFDRNLAMLCNFCGDPFDAPFGPGRPPEYCEQHRGNAFRKAVQEGRAPVSRFPDRFGIDPADIESDDEANDDQEED